MFINWTHFYMNETLFKKFVVIMLKAAFKEDWKIILSQTFLWKNISFMKAWKLCDSLILINSDKYRFSRDD